MCTCIYAQVTTVKMEDTNLKDQRVYRKVWREERDGREYIIMLQSQNKRKNTCYKNYN